jgi:hypothetical protein
MSPSLSGLEMIRLKRARLKLIKLLLALLALLVLFSLRMLNDDGVGCRVSGVLLPLFSFLSINTTLSPLYTRAYIHSTMSNPVYAQLLRDEEDLEATLLPVATRLDGNQANATTATALPLDYFNYDTALAEEAQHELIAPSLPERYDGTLIDEQDSQLVKVAQRSGLIAAAEEKEAIRKADLRGYAQSYHEQNRIQTANKNAKQRDRQGLQMKNDQQEQARLARYHAQKEEEEFTLQIQQESSRSSSSSSKKPTSGYKAGGGYQTSDYQVESYDTKEYQVSQYKSVYD